VIIGHMINSTEFAWTIDQLDCVPEVTHEGRDQAFCARGS
jgi:hypothetical protein